MAKLVDMADMKHRVAATEALLAAAAQDGQERNARLVDFLERVEKNLVRKQEQIDHLEQEKSRSQEEIELLRTLLSDMLTMAETSLEHGSRVKADDLEQVIDRLGTIAAQTNQDAEGGPGSVSAANPFIPLSNGAKDAPAAHAENGQDTPAAAGESEEETDAVAAEGKADAAPARKRGVSKVLSLFGSPQS